MTPKQLRSAAHALRTAANALEAVTTQLRTLSTEIDTPDDKNVPEPEDDEDDKAAQTEEAADRGEPPTPAKPEVWTLASSRLHKFDPELPVGFVLTDRMGDEWTHKPEGWQFTRFGDTSRRPPRMPYVPFERVKHWAPLTVTDYVGEGEMKSTYGTVWARRGVRGWRPWNLGAGAFETMYSLTDLINKVGPMTLTI